MRASYCRYILKFKAPATTSREVMTTKETYFIKLWDDADPTIYGIGECAIFRGLSADDTPEYENTLAQLCHNISNDADTDLTNYSSIKFGLETALFDLKNGGIRRIFATDWSDGNSEIAINGLVWMGNKDEMYLRIKEKLSVGFRCIKLKIGGINFDRELDLLKYIRSKFSANDLEIRLDANGAFAPDNALARLSLLSQYTIHSIEQPIKPAQWDAMRRLCQTSPIPIALDEELIGLNTDADQVQMLDAIMPHYIILKPALCGGLSGADRWIALAEARNIGWWATSALESNIGLNAIAQWVSTYQPEIPQGLGTGALYTNNIPSPLVQERDILRYNSLSGWDIPELNWAI